VDVLIGSVHSGVAMGMVKVARESGTLMLIPNAGADAATGAMCSPNVFRTSFSNWQPVHPLGKVMVDKGHRKAVFITWKYAAGEESLNSFREGYTAAGGSIAKELFVPFPNVEFQALLTEIAAIKPDAVACFFAGGGAVKFVKDYAAAGLKDKIPLYGSGFLTEGVLAAQGYAAEGLLTTLHYADSLDNRQQGVPFCLREGMSPNPTPRYGNAPACCCGWPDKTKAMSVTVAVIAALEGAVIDSPRGDVQGLAIQDIYLRRVERRQQVIGVRRRSGPARGCKLTASTFTAKARDAKKGRNGRHEGLSWRLDDESFCRD
jgi:branched-chain amino acid transport system substrate-binding protein